jgi:cellulose synthase/poly-beta-1,6-N-acetylglucosamine synthase-like glycosyltransferase
MSYIIITITIGYFLVITAFILGFDTIKNTSNDSVTPKNTFSIVIAFRNEAVNLDLLLRSISLLEYPAQLFEVILVNDASNDNYFSVIKNFKDTFPSLNITLLNNKRATNSPKKDAISIAIKKSKFEWVLTTDADCTVPIYWLQLYNQTIHTKKPNLISGPVKFKNNHHFLHHFQNLNFISLQGSTIGSFGIHKPIMCNGANLCYKKTAFKKVNGFIGNSDIASGDDLFLLEKINKRFPNSCYYLKASKAIVNTNSENSWKLFIHQQIRWASKATAYKSVFSKFIGLLVFTMNFLVITLLFSLVVTSYYWQYLAIIFSIKFLIDLVLIVKTATFLKSKYSLFYYGFTSSIYPFFNVFIFLISFFKNYEWKGRIFKQ